MNASKGDKGGGMNSRTNIMKTLLIFRHGKSSWDYPDLPDHDRPLQKRGKRDAPRMGKLLKDEKLVPDLIITSTAERAHRTAELVAENCGYSGEIQCSGALYHSSPEDFTGILNVVADVYERVMIVGHNPVFENFLENLTGESERLPTAAVAQVSLQISDWSELTPRTHGTLKNIWRPKELK